MFPHNVSASTRSMGLPEQAPETPSGDYGGTYGMMAHQGGGGAYGMMAPHVSASTKSMGLPEQASETPSGGYGGAYGMVAPYVTQGPQPGFRQPSAHGMVAPQGAQGPQLVFHPFWGPKSSVEAESVSVSAAATYEEASSAILKAIAHGRQKRPSAASFRGMSFKGPLAAEVPWDQEQDVHTNLGPSGQAGIDVTARNCGWGAFGMDPDCYAKYVLRRPVSYVQISFQWKDQEFGEEKGRCMVRVRDGEAGGEAVTHKLARCRHHNSVVSQTIDARHPIFPHLRPGNTLEVWFRVGGKDHELHVHKFRVQIHYQPRGPHVSGPTAGRVAYMLYRKEPALDPYRRRETVERILNDKSKSPHERTTEIKAALNVALHEQVISSGFALEVGVVCGEAGWREAKEWARRSMEMGGAGLKVAVVEDASAVQADFSYKTCPVFRRGAVHVGEMGSNGHGQSFNAQGFPGYGQSFNSNSNKSFNNKKFANQKSFKERKEMVSTQLEQTKQHILTGTKTSAAVSTIKHSTSVSWYLNMCREKPVGYKRAVVKKLCSLLCVLAVIFAIWAALALWVYLPAKALIDRQSTPSSSAGWVAARCPVTKQACQLEPRCGAGDCQCAQRELVHGFSLTPNCRWVENPRRSRIAASGEGGSRAEQQESKEGFSLRDQCTAKRFHLTYTVQGPANGHTAETKVECNSNDYLVDDAAGLCGPGIGALCGGEFIDTQGYCDVNRTRVGEAVSCWVVPETGHVEFELPTESSPVGEIISLAAAALTILCCCCCCGKYCVNAVKNTTNEPLLESMEDEDDEEYAYDELGGNRA